MLEKIILIEGRVDDEYAKRFNSIPREIFDRIVKADPMTKLEKDGSGNPVNIGPNADQLILRCYLENGEERKFIEDNLDEIINAVNTYSKNRSTYPPQFRNLKNFKSITDFLNLVEGEDSDNIEIKEQEKEDDKLTQLYKKYYSSISREDFDKIIDMDPDTTEDSIGRYAKNLLLPKYVSGEKDFIKDPDKVKEVLITFDSQKGNYYPEEQNLSFYKSVDQLIKVIERGPVSPLLDSLKHNTTPDKKPPLPGTCSNTGLAVNDPKSLEIIGESTNYFVVACHTHAAANAVACASPNSGWSVSEGNLGWCTSYLSGTYYSSYTLGGKVIYNFIHKQKNRGPEGAPLCFQLVINPDRPNEIESNYFLAGWDNNMGESNDHKRFRKMFKLHPEIYNIVKDKEPFSEMDDIKEVGKTFNQLDNGSIKITGPKDLPKVLDNLDIKFGIKHVEISGLKRIPARLFANFQNLLTVKFLDEEVIEIGDQAFKNCKMLPKIELPKSLKIIGQEAFANCQGLKGTVRIPDSVEEIKWRAFADTNVTLTVLTNERPNKLKLNPEDKEFYLKHLKGAKS